LSLIEFATQIRPTLAAGGARTKGARCHNYSRFRFSHAGTEVLQAEMGSVLATVAEDIFGTKAGRSGV